MTNDPKEIQSADKIVLPGVGAFGDCKNAILNIEGLHASLEASVIKNKVPFMGICVGMQLLADLSYEFGTHSGFGWIPGEVRKIASPKEYKIPHMGWNEITFSDHKLFDNCEQGSDFYFVHSFYFLSSVLSYHAFWHPCCHCVDDSLYLCSYQYIFRHVYL